MFLDHQQRYCGSTNIFFLVYRKINTYGCENIVFGCINFDMDILIMENAKTIIDVKM